MPSEVVLLFLVVIQFLHLAAALAEDPIPSEGGGEEWAPVRTIPLQKQYVPIMRDGKTVAYKTAYFGHVHIGSSDPRQSFTVVLTRALGI